MPMSPYGMQSPGFLKKILKRIKKTVDNLKKQ